MIVGSTEKAKKAPVLARNPAVVSRAPFAPAVPTGTLLCTRLPNTKRAPCSWKPSSAEIQFPRVWKNARPTLVLRTINPKPTCSATPLATRRQLIRFRS